jgi:YfiH family protein
MPAMGLASTFATVPALSAVPGLVHGFEHKTQGATRETRDEWRQRTSAALADAGRLLFLRQVHGASVCRAPWEGTPAADAAIATAPRLLLAIETADCLPALLVDPDRRWVAAAHAGWRGTAAGVVRAAVLALVEAGSDPGSLRVALGPAIGPCCYQVGDELRAAFGRAGARFFRPGPDGRPFLDLRAANRAQLLESGVREPHILAVDECTACLGDRYYSYRRDGAGTGRMISFVGFAE